MFAETEERVKTEISAAAERAVARGGRKGKAKKPPRPAVEKKSTAAAEAEEGEGASSRRGDRRQRQQRGAPQEPAQDPEAKLLKAISGESTAAEKTTETRDVPKEVERKIALLDLDLFDLQTSIGMIKFRKAEEKEKESLGRFTKGLENKKKRMMELGATQDHIDNVLRHAEEALPKFQKQYQLTEAAADAEINRQARYNRRTRKDDLEAITAYQKSFDALVEHLRQILPTPEQDQKYGKNYGQIRRMADESIANAVKTKKPLVTTKIEVAPVSPEKALTEDQYKKTLEDWDKLYAAKDFKEADVLLNKIYEHLRAIGKTDKSAHNQIANILTERKRRVGRQARVKKVEKEKKIESSGEVTDEMVKTGLDIRRLSIRLLEGGGMSDEQRQFLRRQLEASKQKGRALRFDDDTIAILSGNRGGIDEGVVRRILEESIKRQKEKIEPKPAAPGVEQRVSPTATPHIEKQVIAGDEEKFTAQIEQGFTKDLAEEMKGLHTAEILRLEEISRDIIHFLIEKWRASLNDPENQGYRSLSEETKMSILRDQVRNNLEALRPEILKRFIGQIAKEEK